MKNIAIALFMGAFWVGCVGTMPTTPLNENNTTVKVENIIADINSTVSEVNATINNELNTSVPAPVSNEIDSTKIQTEIVEKVEKEIVEEVKKKTGGTTTTTQNTMERIRKAGRLESYDGEIIKK